ncbi:zf-HC2 domain-containing protein [Streptomyces gamaensis]|uniref:Zf-HC2 domain-containing protein n=1 Tax=Streptomyces gamaensis TaxID=1763542 RepID=A0ABW0Z8Z9_9ACTN
MADPRAGAGVRDSGAAGDHGGVHCVDVRTALSARIDGEEPPPGVTAAAVEAHLRGCAECRDWGERARRLRLLAAGLD